ncbi:NAD(P)H-dependent glycerol-3-phosphate dehydrogenase [Celeribacter sp.]|uniref:NAD(P)H-dependent glycerol-3-phosphate dehydrogenase n=1 Tax=Celeribacter sp. TaxID=1890673 RepID=UPI003A8F9F49
MSELVVIGAGAFGSALAVALSRDGTKVTLWGRDTKAMDAMRVSRSNPRLPGVHLSEDITVTSDLSMIGHDGPLLIATPMQTLHDMLGQIDDPLTGRAIVACCKGIDLKSHKGPSTLIAEAKPNAIPAILTGPSFAADIARGLPTALTLACANKTVGPALQHQLSKQMLRLYWSEDVIGAELGGALKNVIAIAAGACIGKGLGDSARAALMTRGLAEMLRFSGHFGAHNQTMMGLSGFGDLALTCTSEQSRNFRFGASLGRGEAFDASVTVEGVATAQAVTEIAQDIGLDMPISQAVCAISTGKTSVLEALQSLLSRPLKKE